MAPGHGEGVDGETKRPPRWQGFRRELEVSSASPGETEAGTLASEHAPGGPSQREPKPREEDETSRPPKRVEEEDDRDKQDEKPAASPKGGVRNAIQRQCERGLKEVG